MNIVPVFRIHNRTVLRAVLVVVTLLVVIAFTYIDEHVVVVLPYLPKSLARRMASSRSAECQCSPVSVPEKIQTSDYLSNASILQELKSRHPNIPIELLYGGEAKQCSLLPTLFSILWFNRHWQVASLEGGNQFYLYSAFFDPETDGESSIRLLGVSSSMFPPLPWCHVWFSSTEPPLLLKVTNRDYIDWQTRKSNRQMPFLLRCPLPPGTTRVPLGVSLISEPCGYSTNMLRVIGGLERGATAYKDNIVPSNPTTLIKGWVPAVCGPALYYFQQDFSWRLVEWLEIIREQGFGKVFFYETDVHPNITKVLRHYEKDGFVQVTDYHYPPPYVNDARLRRLWTLVERQKMFAQENTYFTDCVLRHMHEYRFLIHLDPDEVPVILKHDNFTHLLDDLLASSTDSMPPAFSFQWKYFFENLPSSAAAKDLPEYLWVLRHTMRQSKPIGRLHPGTFKSIYDMNAVRGVFSHGTILCESGSCRSKEMVKISPDIAYLGHFKKQCDEECRKDTVHDLTLQRIKDKVVPRVKRVLKTLHLI